MSEIKGPGGIDTGFTRSGEEIGDEGERITILFGDRVKTSEIHAEPE